MKKGFTLIELLGVIVLLGIIATIAFPAVQNAINKSKEKTLAQQKNTIVSAAKRWGADKNLVLKNKLTSDKSSCYVTITALQTSGYIESDKDIIDPTTDKAMTGGVLITYDASYNQYTYAYQSSNTGTSCE